MTRTYHKRQAPRAIAQAQTEPKEGFKFLDASPRQPNGNALATTKFEQAFTALAQERAAALRAMVLAEGEAIARKFVEINLAAIQDQLQLD